MNPSAVSAPGSMSEGVLAVRRWARANLWATLLMAGLMLAALLLIPPATVDNAVDLLFFATGPVLAILELLLLVALLRLFRDRDLVLAALMLGAGGASIVAGLAATVLSLIGHSLESPVSAVGSVLTGVELFLMSALLRRGSAKPERLWLWGVAAAAGAAATSVAVGAPDALLFFTALLLVAFPVFLYRLGELRFPTPELVR